jgi:type I restriction enzyme R subunit
MSRSRAGWAVVKESRNRREFSISEGRLVGARGQRQGSLKVDYVLVFKGRSLVVVEAESEADNYTEGLQQAKDYGQCLELRFACSTNGIKFVGLTLKLVKKKI